LKISFVSVPAQDPIEAHEIYAAKLANRNFKVDYRFKPI